MSDKQLIIQKVENGYTIEERYGLRIWIIRSTSEFERFVKWYFEEGEVNGIQIH